MNKKAQAWIEELAPRVLVPAGASDEEWLAKRVGRVTGSKAPEIMGIGYNGPLEVMAEFKHPELVRQVDKYSDAWMRMEMGRVAEPVTAAKAYADPSRPFGYEPIADIPRLIGHPVHPWAACSPDGLAIGSDGQRILLEYKYHSITMKGQYTTDDGDECMPSKFKAQCLFNADDVVADVSILGAAFSDGTHLFRVIENDQTDIDMMYSKCEMFLEAVETDDASALMSIIEDAEAMNKVMNELFRHSTGEGICINDHLIDGDIANLIDIKKRIKELELDKSGIEARIKGCMGTAKRLETAKFNVSWGQGKGRDKFDRAGFAADNPNLAQKYTQAGLPYRTGLRMTPRKEK